MQFGGGERGGRSFSDFLDALFDPGGFDSRTDVTQDEEFGNQAAAWSTRLIVPGRVPFAAYMQYAGEDRSFEGNFRFGNAALSLGVTFPRLWEHFDLTYEASEWQNSWYVHGIYRDGLSNDGHVLGHWGADSRASATPSARSRISCASAGSRPSADSLQMRARTIDNQHYCHHRATVAAAWRCRARNTTAPTTSP